MSYPCSQSRYTSYKGSVAPLLKAVSIGQEAGHNIGQDRGRERLPDEGDLQLPRMCDDWS